MAEKPIEKVIARPMHPGVKETPMKDLGYKHTPLVSPLDKKIEEGGKKHGDG